MFRTARTARIIQAEAEVVINRIPLMPRITRPAIRPRLPRRQRLRRRAAHTARIIRRVGQLFPRSERLLLRRWLRPLRRVRE